MFLRWQHLLRAIDQDQGPPVGADAVDAIGWYALAVTEVGSLQLAATFAQILQRNDRSIMSTLERTFQNGVRHGFAEGKAEGEAQGKAAGVSSGKADTLLVLLEQRFGTLDAASTARIQGASLDELDRWIRNLLAASSLDEVLSG